MKILVTGGSGFLGSSIIKDILKTYPNYEVINYDFRHHKGEVSRLEGFVNDHRYKEVEGDILDRELIESLIKEDLVEVIINCATYTHETMRGGEVKKALDCHVDGAHVLLELVRKYDISLVQVSSVEVYGSKDEGLIKPHSSVIPSSVYAASKVGGDFLCEAYHKSFGTKVKIVRTANVFGPYQHPREFIPHAILNISQEKYVELEGDGLLIRDWVYVDDFTRAVDTVLHKGTPGGVYLVGSGQTKTNLEVVDILLKQLGKERNLIQYVPESPSTDRRYAVDISGTKALGWDPVYEFDMSLGHLLRWYQSHESWVAALQE
jgi:dTDP-glucose 4,6-dehydratase